jgi:DNA-binding MarR family transcriptional regulator
MARRTKRHGWERIEGLGPALDFMRVVWALDHQLQAASKRMASRIGVTGPQRLALRVIGQRPSVTAGQLAAILHLHPSTLTGILARLQAAGLIERQSDVNDARKARLQLTRKGTAINASTAGTIEYTVAQALRRLPARKVTAAREVLTALASAFSGE